MESLPSLIEILGPAILAGLIGTAGMSLFLTILTLTGITNARMIQAIGSLITRKREGALWVGGVIQVCSGIGFGLIYGYILTRVPSFHVGIGAGGGALLGFLHGIAVAIALVASVAEQHPLPEFRTVGIRVAVAHLVAHVVFGALTGLSLGLLL